MGRRKVQSLGGLLGSAYQVSNPDHVSLFHFFQFSRVGFSPQLVLLISSSSLKDLQVDISLMESRLRLLVIRRNEGKALYVPVVRIRSVVALISLLLLFMLVQLVSRHYVVYSDYLQLSQLLELGQTPSLLNHFLSLFSFGLFSLGVGQPDSSFSHHFLLILIHINRIRPGWLCLRIGIDLTRSQFPQIIKVVLLSSLSNVQKLFIPLVALSRCPTYVGAYATPMARQHSCQVQKLLILLFGPLSLLDGRVQPFIPSLLALPSRLPLQKRTDSTPLVHSVFHDSSLQDLVL